MDRGGQNGWAHPGLSLCLVNSHYHWNSGNARPPISLVGPLAEFGIPTFADTCTGDVLTLDELSYTEAS
jgi:hypothetical protein